MDGWQYHDIGFESQTKKNDGINICKYPWNDMDEPSFEVPHPQYPDQRHKITPYFINTKGKISRLLRVKLAIAFGAFM